MGNDGGGAAPAVVRAITAAAIAGGLRLHARAAHRPEDFRALTLAAAERSRAAREALADFVREVL